MKKISVEGLVKSYKGRRVVDGISISVEPGEVVGLLGPNGAGKTTTFYMTVGLVAPDKGRVFINGEDVTATPMYRRARMGVSYLAQEPSVFRKLTVEENVRAVLEFLDIPRGEMEERLSHHLEELGVLHLADVKAFALSGGERRRVERARSLVNSPAFFLLDEPFSGIVPIAVGDIQDIVKGLTESGIGVLITDHNVSATLGICDRAYIIDKGAILKDGTPQEIMGSQKGRDVYLGERFTM